MKMKTLSLELAKLAMNLIEEVEEDKRDDYLRTVKSLGSMIVQNGLMGTILFLKKRGKNKVVDHLGKMIEPLTLEDSIVEKLMKNEPLDARTYLKAQIAALECAKWLKRCGEILLGGEENETT